VFDRILYERLDGKNRDQNRFGVLIDLDHRLQARTQPQPLDLQVGSYDLELLGERDQDPVGLQKVAEDIGKVQYGAAGAGGLARNDALR
jgi:hypothetical protein